MCHKPRKLGKEEKVDDPNITRPLYRFRYPDMFSESKVERDGVRKMEEGED